MSKDNIVVVELKPRSFIDLPQRGGGLIFNPCSIEHTT